MNYSRITETVKKLKTEYGTADPRRLCDCLRICLLYEPMGNRKESVKGFVIGVDGVFAVVVNSDLPENIQRVIIAHEIGHALMHCSGHLTKYTETALFDELSVFEREANLFAAELLIEDGEILGASTGESFFELASRLCVPAELLDFKIRIMKNRGCNIPEPPLDSHNDFLKNIKVSDE